MELDGEKFKSVYKIVYATDSSFFSTFGIPLLQGRAPYEYEPGSIVLNKSAFDRLDAKDYNQITITNMSGRDNPSPDGMMVRVTGVCEDFNFMPLNKSLVEPLAIVFYGGNRYGVINLKLLASSMDEFASVLEEINAVYDKFDSDEPLNGTFLDSHLRHVYQAEETFKETFTIFSMCAMVISCFGLFGLIVFSNARRRKEIGIRRVNGSTVGQILILLISDYLKYTTIAIVLAVPITYYIIFQWLRDYPYKVSIGWGNFALAGAIVLAIVVLTVGIESWRCATANPVKSLKSE